MLEGDGFQKLPGGLILQWGRKETTVHSSTKITFPVDFPTTKLVVIVTVVEDLRNIIAIPVYATKQYDSDKVDPWDRDVVTAYSEFNVHGRYGGRVNVRKTPHDDEWANRCWLDWFALGY
ncbi:hypothetical protein [Mycoavidus sp. SF9855]|uniref:gp53-like domain-containing protein n=1 Tax=Mycoavidus sp. SF9855 TaxID=2968475 RepID=UPI00211CEE4A|nr:hypothetical protein [Mycoavidus sp. SF9855]UUM21172.1 hypothetical protein NQD60_06890 [Mycoavidus sp. SF9855]